MNLSDNWDDEETTARIAVPDELMDDMHARDPKPTGHSWRLRAELEDHGTLAGYGKGDDIILKNTRGSHG